LRLREFLKREYMPQTIYPNMYDIFNALHYTPFHDVKDVILVQDSYHCRNQVHGLRLSVQSSILPTPSLVNIFKDMQNDLGCDMSKDGHFRNSAKQGLLLLNAVLTVRRGKAHSHRGMGWENFTYRVINVLNEKEHPIVYILWGRAAQRKQALIDTTKHEIVKAPHPSPLSAHR